MALGRGAATLVRGSRSGSGGDRVDIGAVTSGLIASLASPSLSSLFSRIDLLLRNVIGDSEPGLAALETIEAGDAPAKDGPEARTVQRILMRKALSDEQVKEELVAGYKLISVEEFDSLVERPFGNPKAAGLHALVDTKLINGEQLGRLHKLGITSVADLVGAIKTSKAGMGRTLDLEPEQVDTVYREALEYLSDDVIRALDEPVPEHGYGLALGES